MADDAKWMSRAVRLAAQGLPAPNPHVGCVIVKRGAMIGEGFHAGVGLDHAEVAALKMAEGRTKNATAYVTLEPCDHTGRTPPCSEALILAGVRRVVVAVRDPNPRAAGGADRLRGAGVKVDLYPHPGAERVARRFLTSARRNRPHVTLKAAITLDGRMARADGSSQWITGEEARRDARRLRAECGSVMVGYRTALADDPQLDARDVPDLVRPVRKWILDPRGALTGDERAFQTPGEATALTGDLSTEDILRAVRDAGETSVLIEGGPKTLSRFAAVADEVVLYQAPVVFGNGPGWADGAPESEWAAVETTRFGRDVKTTYVRPDQAPYWGG